MTRWQLIDMMHLDIAYFSPDDRLRHEALRHDMTNIDFDMTGWQEFLVSSVLTC